MNPASQKNSPTEQPLLAHLSELRTRLFKVLLIIAAGLGFTVFYAEAIYTWLQAPLMRELPPGSQFITLGLMEGWIVYFKVACVAALFLTAPLWCWQLWGFFAPGLHGHEKRWVACAAIASAAAFIAGGYFAYAAIMPVGFHYLIGVLHGSSITLMPQMEMYLGLTLRMMLAFGVVFQLPLIIIFLVRMGIVSTQTLGSYRRHAVVGAFVIGAILTPPDIVSQISMSIPLIVLFEVGLLCAKMLEKKKADQ